MSLLMEALKKAEQAKQAGEASAAQSTELRLEPIDTSATSSATVDTAPSGKQLPELPSQLEVLDADFIAHATPQAPKQQPRAATEAAPRQTAAPPRAAAAPAARPSPAPTGPHPTATSDGERKAAQQLFAAKQPDRSRKGFAIAMGGLALAGATAIGGYFWWQLQPKSGLAVPGLAAKTPMAPAPPASAPPAPPSPAPLAPQAAPSLAAAAGAAKDDDDAEEAPPRRSPPAPATSTPAPPASTPARPETRPTTPAEPEGPVRITRSQLKVNPALAKGFAALNAGDLAAAQAEYERVLRAEPLNSDALHGLAAVALRQGDIARAEGYWLKALEADPKDAVAQAALINSGGRAGSAPQVQESRLKTLIAAQPEVAALHFALGNVLARQTRWNEAQQAYFKAFSIEPEHPDYVFNLAVSLDQLRQPRLAAQYYSQALAAAAQRPAGFDKAQAAARLRELQP